MHTPDEQCENVALFDASTLRVVALASVPVESPASAQNQTPYVRERIRAVDAVARCMQSSALGG